MFVMFPYYCAMYSIAPTSQAGQFITKPFVQFVCHKASYLYFLSKHEFLTNYAAKPNSNFFSVCDGCLTEN